MQQDILQYQRALFLRKKKGYTYNEIMREIPVAKSTLSGWLCGVELSAGQKQRIKENWLSNVRAHNRKHNLGEWNRRKRQIETVSIHNIAKQELAEMNNRECLIAGLMLYWAEGTKGGDVRISNSDPLLIIFIMRWFRDCLKITNDRFCAEVHYHQGQDESSLRRYWSGVTGIPVLQFTKSFCKPPGTGHRTHYLQWGTLQIRVRRSGNLYYQIQGWRDGLIESIISGKQYR